MTVVLPLVLLKDTTIVPEPFGTTINEFGDTIRVHGVGVGDGVGVALGVGVASGVGVGVGVGVGE